MLAHTKQSFRCIYGFFFHSKNCSRARFEIMERGKIFAFDALKVHFGRSLAIQFDRWSHFCHTMLSWKWGLASYRPLFATTTVINAAADLIKSTMQNSIDKLPFQRLLMFDFLYSTAAAAAALSLWAYVCSFGEAFPMHFKFLPRCWLEIMFVSS